MMKKKNTFNDFVTLRRYLRGQKFTSKDRMIANGGSAGGSQGVITKHAPDLFRAVVATCLSSTSSTPMMDASIPLTAQEWQQWGDPHNAEQVSVHEVVTAVHNSSARRIRGCSSQLLERITGGSGSGKWVAS